MEASLSKTQHDKWTILAVIRWFSTRNNSSSSARQENRNPQQETREAINYRQELELSVLQYLQDYTVGLKLSNPITDLDRHLGFQEVEAPRFRDNWHMNVVRLSALRTGCLYPRKYSWYSFLLEAESTPGP